MRFAAVFGGTVDADNPPIGDHMRSIALVGDNGFLQRGQFVIRRLQPIAQRCQSGGIGQTRDWLDWLDDTLNRAATSGMDMAEVMVLPLPERFAGLPLARSEFERSVTHLYSRYEQQTLNTAAPSRLKQK